MSAIGFLVLLVIAIIALMLLMTKVKLNPVMSLFVVALGFGVTLGIFGTEGYSFMETLTLITTGFGNTLGSLGMPIILGAVLAMGVQDTGAAKSIANFFIRLFRGKNLELAPSLTAYVVSIPVFGDITTILCSNIANVLGKRKQHFYVHHGFFHPDRSEPDPRHGPSHSRHSGRFRGLEC